MQHQQRLVLHTVQLLPLAGKEIRHFTLAIFELDFWSYWNKMDNFSVSSWYESFKVNVNLDYSLYV